MPNDDNKILKYNHREKSMGAPCVTYVDLECLLEKMHLCQNNPKKSYTEKKIKHTPSCYSLFTNVHLVKQKTNLIVTMAKTMKRFCKDLACNENN